MKIYGQYIPEATILIFISVSLFQMLFVYLRLQVIPSDCCHFAK